MNELLMQFIKDIGKNEELLTKFNAMIESKAPVEKWVEFAKENGYEMKEEDFKSFEESKELNLDELENVTGGVVMDDGGEKCPCPYCGELMAVGTREQILASLNHVTDCQKKAYGWN